MASSCVVPIAEIENVRKHPNADKLDLADVLGYQVAIQKNMYCNGDKIIFFPPDTLIPSEWAEEFGIKQLLRGKVQDRVGKIRLRGEPSFGLVVPVPDEKEHWEVGQNVAEYYGCKKYEPPIRPSSGNIAMHDSAIDPFFQKYTDIENGRIFIDVLEPGEEVVVTEKIHGSNSRTGIINGIEVAGSRTTRKKKPEPDETKRSTYWYPWGIYDVCSLLHVTYNMRDFVVAPNNSILLYGEIFGGSVQKLHYGISKGKGFGFRAFDLMIDGKYLDYDVFKGICIEHDVLMAPELYRGPFDMAKIIELADGDSTIEGADNIREGVVVRPVKERTHPKIGRVILKYIGTNYQLGLKEGDDNTDA